MNWIDEIFRRKLGSNEQDYSANVWENIDKELFPRKKDNYTGLWLLSLGVIFLLPIAILKDLDNRIDTDQTAQAQVAELESSKNQTAQLKTTKALKNLEPSEVIQLSNLGSEAGVSQAENQEEIESIASDQTAQTADNQLFTQSNNESNQKSRTASILGSTRTVSSNDAEKSTSLNDNTDSPNRIMSRVTMESSYNTTKQTKIVSSSKTRRIAPNNITKTNQTGSEIESEAPSNLFNSKSNDSALRLKSKITSPKPIANSFEKNIRRAVDIPLSIQDDFCEDGSFQINRWYSEFYFSIGAGLKAIRANDPSLNNYADLRSEAESNRTSYQLGFGVGYELDNGLLFEGGFEYGQYNYRFEYPDPDNRNIQTVITIDTTIINQNDTIFSVDTSFVDNSPLLTSNNKHQVIEIPLLVGYNYAISKKMSLAIKTGVAVNLYAQSIGSMYNSEGNVVNFINDGMGTQSAYYKSSFGLAIPLQAQLYYKATPEIDIFLKSGVKFYTGPITRSSYALEEKLSYTHIGAGFRVKI